MVAQLIHTLTSPGDGFDAAVVDVAASKSLPHSGQMESGTRDVRKTASTVMASAPCLNHAATLGTLPCVSQFLQGWPRNRPQPSHSGQSSTRPRPLQMLQVTSHLYVVRDL